MGGREDTFSALHNIHSLLHLCCRIHISCGLANAQPQVKDPALFSQHPLQLGMVMWLRSGQETEAEVPQKSRQSGTGSLPAFKGDVRARASKPSSGQEEAVRGSQTLTLTSLYCLYLAYLLCEKNKPHYLPLKETAGKFLLLANTSEPTDEDLLPFSSEREEVTLSLTLWSYINDNM